MAQHHSPQDRQTRFVRQVGNQQRRKLKARRSRPPDLWLGLGLMGLVGWSVVVPTLVGLAVGLWLDHHYPGQFSWTLLLLLGGLGLGCLNAGLWAVREQSAIERPPSSSPPPQDPPHVPPHGSSGE